MLTRIVATERGPVEYTEAGAGVPVLYFHGTGVTGDVMVAVEQSMIEDGFRVIVPNRPGYGLTPLAPHFTAADCAHLAASLLDSLGVADTCVMGSSGGAAFALSFALHFPGRTKALVLLCPQLHRWDHKRWLPKASRWTLPLLKRAFLRRLLLKLHRFQLRRMSVAQLLKMEAGDRYPEIAADPASQALGAMTLEAMRQWAKCAGFGNDFAVFTSEDIVGPAASLEMSTLVIHDAVDPLAPVDHVDWFVSRFPKCERIAVHAGGHLVWVGADADVVHASCVRFLREHASGMAEPSAAAGGRGKLAAPKPLSLDELLRGVTDENLHGECDTGPAAGREAW
jgi:pimeloyl-ACP methyl ester carboxylesterase